MNRKELTTVLLDKPINTNKWTENQHNYWKKSLNYLRKKHIAIGYHGEYQWRNAISYPEKWRPDLIPFIARVRHAIEMISQGHTYPPTIEKEATTDIQKDCRAIRCMMTACNEIRNRPYAHFIKWWDENNEEDRQLFMTHHQEIHPYLKPTYRLPWWKEKFKKYGYLFCWAHYYHWYHIFYPSHPRPLPHESWFPLFYRNETNLHIIKLEKYDLM